MGSPTFVVESDELSAPKLQNPRETITLCQTIRDQVLEVLEFEKQSPIWTGEGRMLRGAPRQELALKTLLETHLTVENFTGPVMPHPVKCALSDLRTHQDSPVGSLFKLLAETVEVAGPQPRAE